MGRVIEAGPSFRMRLRWAKSISTFFRCRLEVT